MPSDKLSHADRLTLEALFRHPAARNLRWADAAHLVERLGSATREHNGRIVLVVGAHKEIVPEPKGKDMTAEEVERLRKFLEAAGVTPQSHAPEATAAAAHSGDILVAIDHREARLFHIEGGAEKTLRPYDPHHFLHHLTHKDDENAYRGQRAPEDPAFYQAIAAALGGASRVVVVGHGEGKSNAGLHLEETLRAKHPDLWKRVVSVTSADLSHTSERELALIAKKELSNE